MRFENFGLGIFQRGPDISSSFDSSLQSDSPSSSGCAIGAAVAKWNLDLEGLSLVVQIRWLAETGVAAEAVVGWPGPR